VRKKNVPTPYVPRKSNTRKQAKSGSASLLFRRVRAFWGPCALILALGGTIHVVIRLEPPARGGQHQ
jgi:hypothetical protein